MGGEEAFDTYMGLSLSEPVLPDCNFTRASQCFSHVGGTGWLESTGVGYFPSFMWQARARCSWVLPSSRLGRLS